MITKFIVPSAFACVFLLAGITSFSSCKKTCYDREMYELHRNDFCTTDCPGVVGCDGNTYCNECEANRQGISVP